MCAPQPQKIEGASECRLTVDNEAAVLVPPPPRGVWCGVYVSGSEVACFAGMWAILSRLRSTVEVGLQCPLNTPAAQLAVDKGVGRLEALSTCEVSVTQDAPRVHEDDTAVCAAPVPRARSTQ